MESINLTQPESNIMELDKKAPEAEVVVAETEVVVAETQKLELVAGTVLIAPVANPLIQMAIDQAAERLAKELAQ